MYIRYFFFFFKQKTAYEMRMSDWSSDVCSSDLRTVLRQAQHERVGFRSVDSESSHPARQVAARCVADLAAAIAVQYRAGDIARGGRSEEHTSELQSLMRTSYAVFCLKKKKHKATRSISHNSP